MKPNRRTSGTRTWSVISTMVLTLIAFLVPQNSSAQESAQDLAQELTNPVADLISVPFQFNYDDGYGPVDDGKKAYVNIQPVIPFEVSEGWNLISRTILPVAWQSDVVPGAGEQFGLGDTTQSLFMSPKASGSSGIIWGAGPVFLLPTATDDLLGSKKWGVGPTAVALRIDGPWTYGALVNHIWSVAGDSSRNDISNSFMQPFVAYTTSDAWTFSMQSETTYNWNAETWSVPISGLVSKLVRIGGLPVSLGAGVRYWAQSPANGPEGFGARLVITFVLPK